MKNENIISLNQKNDEEDSLSGIKQTSSKATVIAAAMVVVIVTIIFVIRKRNIKVNDPDYRIGELRP